MNIMITPAYESFVNNVCYDIANEGLSDKIESGLKKIKKFWDKIIAFIQKKINQFKEVISKILGKVGINIPDAKFTIDGNSYIISMAINTILDSAYAEIQKVKKDHNNFSYVYLKMQDLEKRIHDPSDFLWLGTFSENLCRQCHHSNETLVITKTQLNRMYKKCEYCKYED